jgi:Tfp pilus assembly protein PilF
MRFWANRSTTTQIVEYRKAAELDPKNALIYNNWGSALPAQKKYDEAIEMYKKATELDLNYGAAYEDWGKTLKALGKLDEAKIKLKRADELTHPPATNSQTKWMLLASGRGQHISDGGNMPARLVAG